MREGLIVAGGRSTRFGAQDKAVAPLDGVPMIRRVADRIAPSIDRLAINCRADQREEIESAMRGSDLPISYRLDAEPDLGPLGGIENGMRESEADWTFVIACDMPFVQQSVIELLFDRAHDAKGAVPRIGEWFEPLHAVYGTEAMWNACRAALAGNDDRIVHAMDRIEFVEVTAAEIEQVGTLETFENVNTRSEFEDAEAWFANREGV